MKTLCDLTREAEEAVRQQIPTITDGELRQAMLFSVLVTHKARARKITRRTLKAAVIVLQIAGEQVESGQGSFQRGGIG